MSNRIDQEPNGAAPRVNPRAIPEINPTQAEVVGHDVPPSDLTVRLDPVQAQVNAEPAGYGASPSDLTVQLDPARLQASDAGPAYASEYAAEQPMHAPAHAAHAVGSAFENAPYAADPAFEGAAPAAAPAFAAAGPSDFQAVPDKRKRTIVIAALIAVAAIIAIVATVWYNSFTKDLDKNLEEGSNTEVAEQLVQADLDKPFYMLLLGSDVRISTEDAEAAGGWGDDQLSDVMILARVASREHLVTLVSIPRDTPYELEDGTIVKINELYALGGAAKSVEGVSKVAGVDIAHYAEVHIAELEEIVDALGGVEVEVDQRLGYKDALTHEMVTLEPGVQTINGQQAQIFARVRKDYEEDQEEHRQSNVRQLMMAILDKVLDRPLLETPDMIVKLAGFVGTDLTAADLTTLAMDFKSDGSDVDIYEATAPSNGDINDEADGQWLCFENPEGWAELMRRVDAGEDPSDIDYSATEIPWPPHYEEEE